MSGEERERLVRTRTSAGKPPGSEEKRLIVSVRLEVRRQTGEMGARNAI